MIDLEQLLLSPRGRLGRQSYWTLIVLLVAASVILSLIPFFGTLASIPLLWPFGCVVARRLHDAGRGAWPVPLVAALSAAANITSFVAAMMVSSTANVVGVVALALPAMLLGGVSMVATLSLLLLAGMARGTEGPNRFGPPESTPATFAALMPRDHR